MFHRIFILIWVSVSFAFSVFAQRTEKVKASYTYIAPENVSLEMAKEIALERAKIQAIADEFGTIISQQTSALVSNVNGNSSVDMYLLGGSEVKGEWIETISEPEFHVSYEQNMLVVGVEVKGRIREIIFAPIDFTAKILCNGTEDRFERTDFRNGDDLYLSFCSPVAGYLAVYLVDDKKNAFCLLPYQNQVEGVFPVEANHKYVFFSEKNASKELSSIVDEYSLTAEKQEEHNLIYVVFSPNGFTKASDNQLTEALPRQLDYFHFQSWLEKCRRRDKEFCFEKKIITIKL